MLRDTEGRVVCARCHVADRFFKRMRGLLGRRGLARDECMLIRPAGSVHTFFMRFAIDVVFLDRDLRVVGIEADVRPWRVAARRGARAVVEMPAGAAAERGVRLGAQLVVADEPAG